MLKLSKFHAYTAQKFAELVEKIALALAAVCISALGARSLYLCVNIVIYIFKRVPLSPWGENCIMNIQRVAIRFICHLGFQINTISPPSRRGYLENKA